MVPKVQAAHVLFLLAAFVDSPGFGSQLKGSNRKYHFRSHKKHLGNLQNTENSFLVSVFDDIQDLRHDTQKSL